MSDRPRPYIFELLMDRQAARQARSDAAAYERVARGQLRPSALVLALMDAVDRSPRRDWLTSAQAEREANRLIRALAAKGYEIHRIPPSSVEVEPSQP